MWVVTWRLQILSHMPQGHWCLPLFWPRCFARFVFFSVTNSITLSQSGKNVLDSLGGEGGSAGRSEATRHSPHYLCELGHGLSFCTSIWPYSWPTFWHCVIGASCVTAGFSGVTEKLPSIMAAWHSGECGHGEKETCVYLPLSAASLQVLLVCWRGRLPRSRGIKGERRWRRRRRQSKTHTHCAANTLNAGDGA